MTEVNPLDLQEGQAYSIYSRPPHHRYVGERVFYSKKPGRFGGWELMFSGPPGTQYNMPFDSRSYSFHHPYLVGAGAGAGAGAGSGVGGGKRKRRISKKTKKSRSRRRR